MISPEELKKSWKKKYTNFITYPLETLKNVNIINTDKIFLCEIGLPESCAPYLRFLNYDKGGMSQVLNFLDKENIDEDDIDELSNMLLLGMTGSGELIAIDTGSNEIVCIDHEDGSISFMNSSINHLAESILSYHKFLGSIQNRYDALVDVNEMATEEDIELLKNSFQNIDKDAIEEDSFWAIEIENFKD